ncbi:MAG: PA0069 family radical SAM protein [Flavobacteriales bacterium]|nr:PA0069 family radical SAM protein [Flavobacteriales bacterium]MCB9365219.1 PA0069 family radical SAM protein [Flavobacteriales bacterium]
MKGRGSQIKVNNRYFKQQYVSEHIEGLDTPFLEEDKTKYIVENPKKIVNKIYSPTVPFMYSMNPYQGCEHGCIYCYARESHQYWGYGAGLDFERKIICKPEAPKLLANQFNNKNWIVSPIMLSGNTDCYQPIERKLQITRALLKVCLKYKHPISILTKNSLIQRDIDILAELAKLNLVHVALSITSLDNKLRSVLEPRTATVEKKLETLELLVANNIPTGIMVAPIIPGLNSHEIPAIVKKVAKLGALSVGYTTVRLNGEIAEIFEDWIVKTFPDKTGKILNQIKEINGGNLYSKGKNRMKLHSETAVMIKDMFRIAKNNHLKGRSFPEYDLTLFARPTSQLKLF